MQIQIKDEDAKSSYNVSTDHKEEINQERRFRLKVDHDGKYICTYAITNDKGYWQNSHFHHSCHETYIVQKGWIILALPKGNEIQYLRYNCQEIFSIPPFLIHNIYMSKDSIIHTIKHGLIAKDSDWNECKGFDKKLEQNHEQLLKIASEHNKGDEDMPICHTLNISNPHNCSFNAVNNTSNSQSKDCSSSSQEYPETYRHFDKLIWQAPTWASAFFFAVILSLFNIRPIDNNATSNSFIGQLLNIETKFLFSGILFISAITLFILTYVLHRFRMNQNKFKVSKQKKAFFGAFFWLDSLIRIECLTLFSLGIWLIDISNSILYIVGFCFILLFLKYLCSRLQ